MDMVKRVARRVVRGNDAADVAANVALANITANVAPPAVASVEWINSEHKKQKVKEITAAHTLITAPEKLCDFTPRTHQLAIVQAALDLENKRALEFAYNIKTSGNPFISESVTNVSKNMKVETSAIVISDAFGAGKTLDVIMIIMLRQTPRAMPSIINGVIPAEPTYGYRRTYKKKLDICPIVREHQHKLVYPNLIITGPGVLLKWKEEIKRAAPHFKIFTVGTITDLKMLYKIYKDGRLNRYNVVLLKNGMVRGSFRLDEEEKDDCTKIDCEYGIHCSQHIKGTRHLINVVRKMTRGNCWSRVFYDDFDTIQIPMHATHIKTLMTYYISATRKHSGSKRINATGTDLKSVIAARAQRMLNDVARDDYLFTNFNLRNEDHFRDESLKLPFVKFMKYVYKNPDDKYIKLIGAMGEHDANEIMEMLNGDAVGTAAETLGIATTSVADIFEKILADKYQKYMLAVKVLASIDTAYKYVSKLPPVSERTNDKGEPKPYNEAEIAKIVARLGKGKPHTAIKYQSRTLLESIEDLKHQKELVKVEVGRAIDRVKENIKEGECPICLIPLEENDAIINKCCGIVMCADCGIKGARMGTVDMYGRRFCDGAETVIKGNCPQCRAPIQINELIFINQEFDLENMLKAQGDEKPEPKPEPAAAAAAVEVDPIDAIENPKMKALYQIIHGIKPDNQTVIHPHIASLIQGAKDVPVPAGSPRKIIVFASFTETLGNIQTFLKEQNVNYMRLIGTYKQIHATIAEFRTNDVPVMLINSTTNCAGLDLQFTSDLVFFHKIMDTNIQSQVAGRLQRIGRKHNGNIHWLLYTNEKDSI